MKILAALYILISFPGLCSTINKKAQDEAIKKALLSELRSQNFECSGNWRSAHSLIPALKLYQSDKGQISINQTGPVPSITIEYRFLPDSNYTFIILISKDLKKITSLTYHQRQYNRVETNIGNLIDPIFEVVETLNTELTTECITTNF